MSPVKLYAHKCHYSTVPALVAAKYSKATFEFHETCGTEASEVTGAGVTGLPALITEEGVQLVGSAAVAYFLASEKQTGQSAVDRARIQQWLWLAQNTLVEAIASLVLPSQGLAQPNQKAQQSARDALTSAFKHLDAYLAERTYLVGERISLADLFLAAHLAPLFQYAIDAEQRKTLVNVMRWFLTITAQPEWKEAAGVPTLCDKVVPFDSKKFAELQKKSEHAASEGKGKKEEKKKEEKKEAPAKAKEEKKEKEKKDNEEEEQDEDEPKEKERPDPFKSLPTSTKFVMDEWKRTYSNAPDKEKVAMPWFWEHFDNDCYSLWVCEYLDPSDLKLVFMTSNLITGMYQRLEKMMRNSFAVMNIFGVDKNNTIAGVWLWKGQDLAFKLDEDWQADYESYSWRKLDLAAPETRALVENFWIAPDSFEYGGRKIHSTKCLK